MYTIYYNDSLIYDPSFRDPAYSLLDAKYSGELGKVDTLDFTILPMHPFYNVFDRLQTGIVAYRDGIEIFRGRVLSTSVDLEGEKQVQCEGDLAYLLDSIQPKMHYDEITCGELFGIIIANHNALVEPAKRFTVGEITALKRNDIIEVSLSSYSDTRNVLDENILKSKGGYLRTRYSNGVTYIDWIEEYTRRPQQDIRLGVNLISYQEEVTADNFYTVYFPTGSYPVDPDETDDSRDRTMTIEDVNDGSPYIELTELVQRYGRIYKAESYSGPDTPAELLAEAMNDVDEYRKTLKRTVEVGALDLHYLDPDVDMLMLGDHVHIYSEPHNEDETLVVQKVSFNFTSPEEDSYSFGDGLQTLTKKNNADNSAIGATAEKASAQAEKDSANLKLHKNRIDIVANNMTLEVKDTLDINANMLNVAFKKLDLESKAYTYRTDAEKARFDVLKREVDAEWIEVTNQYVSKVDPETGQAWQQQITNTISEYGSTTNILGTCMDSEQGMFSWDGFRKEFEHLTDDVADTSTRLKKVGIRFDVPASELKLFATNDYVQEVRGIADEATRRIGLAEITLCGDENHPGIVSSVGQYVDGGLIVSLVNQTPDTYSINANKIRLYAGGDDGEALTSYLAAEKGKIELVVMTDENGNWVVNPASIVASVNSQGRSGVRIHADQIDLDGYSKGLSGGFDALRVRNLTIDQITSSNGSIYVPNIYLGTTESAVHLGDALADVQVVQNGNVYTLQKKTIRGTEWVNTEVSFSRATTLSGAWGSGTFTVGASPQGNSRTTTLMSSIPNADITWNGNTASFPVKAVLDGSDIALETGRTLSINAQSRYNAGYNSGYSSGESAGLANARLSLNSANHTVNIGSTGELVSATVRATGTVGSFDGAEMAYPITVKAFVHRTEMYTDTILVYCEPEGAYSDGYAAGYEAGFNAGSQSSTSNTLVLNPQTGVVSVGAGGSTTSAAVTVHAREVGWDSVGYKCTIRIEAKVGGTTMASSNFYVYNPNG